MGRIARVVLPGIAHHVTQRGVRSMKVFRSDDDRQEYLRLMAGQAERFGVRFLSWCLMGNHIHLVAVPQAPESLAQAIGEAHRRYTLRINSRHGVRGYLFQGRFGSCPLDERHGLAAVRYVERNPVRAGIAEQAWTYPWSSAAYHVGIVSSDPLVKEADRDLGGLVDNWRDFLRHDPREMGALRLRTRTGRPCGEESFVARAEQRTARTLRALARGRRKKVLPARVKGGGKK